MWYQSRVSDEVCLIVKAVFTEEVIFDLDSPREGTWDSEYLGSKVARIDFCEVCLLTHTLNVFSERCEWTLP